VTGGLRLQAGWRRVLDALHRRGTVSDAMPYAFDLLGSTARISAALPLGDRKKRLARVLARTRAGLD
jgi:hypothetical protein